MNLEKIAKQITVQAEEEIAAEKAAEEAAEAEKIFHEQNKVFEEEQTRADLEQSNQNIYLAAPSYVQQIDDFINSFKEYDYQYHDRNTGCEHLLNSIKSIIVTNGYLDGDIDLKVIASMQKNTINIQVFDHFNINFGFSWEVEVGP